MVGSVTEEQRRGDRAALPGGADDRDRLTGVDALGDPVDVVVWDMDRPGDVALVPLGALAYVEHLYLVSPCMQRRDVDSLERSRRPLLLTPTGHPAGEVAGDVADPDRCGEVCGVDRIAVVPADEHHVVVAVGHPRELGAEPGADRRVTDRTRDVRVVELQVGADVDDQRHLPFLLLNLSRGQRLDLDGGSEERAAVERDDRLEVRGLGPERRGRRADELVLVLDLKQFVVRVLVGDRR